MEFRSWLETKELFQNVKKQLQDEILASLGPNQDLHHVLATRLSNYQDRDGVYSGSSQVLKIFNDNPKIWELMNKAFPREVNKANQIRNWLKASSPTDTVSDLFQQIGLSSEPIVVNKAVKSSLDKLPAPSHKSKPPQIKQPPVQGQVPMPQANNVQNTLSI